MATHFGKPIGVRPLLTTERSALLDLLRGLPKLEWANPTACAGWLVRDVKLHLL